MAHPMCAIRGQNGCAIRGLISSSACEGSPHSYMHDDDLYGVQGIKDEVLVWISRKGIVVCPLLSFYFYFSLFIFIFLVASMALSI